jgi:hypothetical protein
MKIGSPRKRQSSISEIVHAVIMGRAFIPVMVHAMVDGMDPSLRLKVPKKLPEKQGG